MAREKITDGTKKKQFYFLIEEAKFDRLGKERLKNIIAKAVEKELHNIDKGKVHNQIDIIQAIAEIENTEKL